MTTSPRPNELFSWGFTIIELLVDNAITAILASLLLPALSWAKICPSSCDSPPLFRSSQGESASRLRAEAALWRAAKAGGVAQSKTWRRSEVPE